MKVVKAVERRSKRWVAPFLVGALGAAALLVWVVRARMYVDPDRLWSKAERDFAAGLYDQTEAELRRLETIRQPTSLDRILKAQLAMAHKQDDAAIVELARVPDGDPMAPQARLLVGQLELRRQHASAAEKAFRAALELDPKLVQAHRELVYIYGMLLRRRELRAEFLALSELSTLTFDNVFHWCLTRNSMWEPNEITKELERYLKADPADRWSRLALAENLRQVGRRDEAMKTLEMLPANDPDALTIRVSVSLDRGDDETAETLLKAGPRDHPELARLRGRFALAHRDGAAAVEHFRNALAAEPDHRDALLGMGQALTTVGKNEEAAPYLAAARDIDALGVLVQRAGNISVRRSSTVAERSDPEFLHALGAACEKAKRIPEARAWYRLAILADPLDTRAQKALYRLQDAGKTAAAEPG